MGDLYSVFRGTKEGEIVPPTRVVSQVPLTENKQHTDETYVVAKYSDPL